jgi:hypothetical protein
MFSAMTFMSIAALDLRDSRRFRRQHVINLNALIAFMPCDGGDLARVALFQAQTAAMLGGFD